MLVSCIILIKINNNPLEMKRLLVIAALMFSNCCWSFAEEKILITINQFVNHPALDAAQMGIKQALEDRSLLPKHLEIIAANAQGSIATSIQIAKYHASLKPKVMIGIATPAAQSINKARSPQTTLAFVAISDPQSAGLTKGQNIIGVTDWSPIDKLLTASIKTLPQLKNIGIIFNPGENNSIETIKDIEKEAKKRNIEVKKVAIDSLSNIKIAMQKLTGKVDAIYVPKDNMIVSAIDIIVQTSLKSKIPIIASDPSLADKGVLLALGCDYFNTGVQLGNMIADIIQGVEVSPNIAQPKVNTLKINHQTARMLGITIPPDLQLGQ